MVHLLFNVIGATMFIVISLTLPFATWVEQLAGDNLRLQIAFAHIIFNVTTTVIMLPLSGMLERLARLVVRGEDKQEEPMRLTYFDDRLFSTPPIAAKQLFREVTRMGELVKANYDFAMEYFFSTKELPLDEFDNRENVIDFLNAEVTAKMIELRGLTLSSQDVHLMGSLFHVVNDLERIGDHCTNIVEIGTARRKLKTKFSPKAEQEVRDLNVIITRMLDQAMEIVNRQIIDPETIAKVKTDEAEVDKLCETLADRHVDRVKNKKCTPKNGMLYMDLLNNLERIADHADNLSSSVDVMDDGKKLLW